MTFLTNEERLREAKRLGDIKTLKDKEEHRVRWEHMGGGSAAKRSCWSCKDWTGGDRCENAAASLKGSSLKTNRVRYPEGLCGPDGVFWTKKSLLSKNIVNRILLILIIGSMLAAFIGFGVWLVGWQAVVSFFVVLGLFCLIGGESRY